MPYGDFVATAVANDRERLKILKENGYVRFMLTGTHTEAEEAKYAAYEAYKEEWFSNVRNQFNQSAEGMFSDDLDEDVMAERIRESMPTYQDHSTPEERLQREERRADALKAIHEGAWLTVPSDTNKRLTMLGTSRQGQALFKYAEIACPEAAEDILQITEMLDQFDQTKDPEIKKQIDKKFQVISKTAMTHFENKVRTVGKELCKELTDEELIKKWPEFSKELALAGEMELICKDYYTDPQKQNEMMHAAKTLIGMYPALSARMDFLSSPLAGIVDFDELLKHSPAEFEDYEVNHSIEQAENKIITYVGRLTVNMCRTNYMRGAREHFGVGPEAEMLLRDMDGNIMSSLSSEAWTTLGAKGQPVYVVPKDDPAAEPVLVQPLTKFGYAATGEQIQNLGKDDLAMMKPVPEPNPLTKGLSSLLGGIGKLFGKDWRLDSCVKYEEYEKKQARITGTRDQYAELTDPAKLGGIKEAFVAHQVTQTGKTPEQLEEIHKAKEAEMAAKKRAQTVREMQLKHLKASLTPAALGYQGVEDMLGEGEPAEDLLGEDKTVYQEFTSKITAVAEADPATREYLLNLNKANPVDGVSYMQSLYESFKADYNGERSMDVAGMVKKAAHQNDPTPESTDKKITATLSKQGEVKHNDQPKSMQNT